jgi:hypothetical protein
MAGATRQTPLARHYTELEGSYEITEDLSYGDLVVPNGNASAPIHRWFYIKEAFSSELLERIASDVQLHRRHALDIIDPFVGSGTAAVSAQHLAALGSLRVRSFYGIEQNPFLAFAARTKTRGFAEGDADDLRALREDLMRRGAKARSRSLPALSTFRNTNFFPASALRTLIATRSIAQEWPNEMTRELALLATAASLEPISRLRRDGRALRYEPKKRVSKPKEELRARLTTLYNDLVLPKPPITPIIHRGDARNTDTMASGSFNLALFSPPYPNNIDYTEVYKLEAWFLGFVSDGAEFRAQRHLTLRSHPSVLFDRPDFVSTTSVADEFASLTGPIVQAVPPGRYAKGRRRVIIGYCEDLLQTFFSLRRLIRRNGLAIVIVGNSLHAGMDGPVMIASDLLVARLADLAGFAVERIVVARRPIRRGVDDARLRESLVFLRQR